MADESGGGDQPIVIKKIVKGGGHHGGAWKVAYADFVTAMMAFFLLMWLLSMASDEQLQGVADYFSPTVASTSSESGAGGVLGGVSMSTEKSMISDGQPMTQPAQQGASGSLMNAAFSNQGEGGEGTTEEQQAAQELQQQEEQKLNEVKDAIESAMMRDPELADLSENLLMDMTREGLRIQVVDSEGKPMFPSGSSRMFPRTQKLIQQVGTIIQNVPNDISVRGHTDSVPYGSNADYTNWELSSDRANASRRVLKASGIAESRLHNVVGKADTDHLLPNDPTNARNRRISIILLREELTDPENYKKRVQELAKKKRASLPPVEILKEPPPLPSADPTRVKPQPAQRTEPESRQFKKTDGDVQFP